MPLWKVDLCIFFFWRTQIRTPIFAQQESCSAQSFFFLCSILCWFQVAVFLLHEEDRAEGMRKIASVTAVVAAAAAAENAAAAALSVSGIGHIAPGEA